MRAHSIIHHGADIEDVHQVGRPSIQPDLRCEVRPDRSGSGGADLQLPLQGVTIRCSRGHVGTALSAAGPLSGHQAGGLTSTPSWRHRRAVVMPRPNSWSEMSRPSASISAAYKMLAFESIPPSEPASWRLTPDALRHKRPLRAEGGSFGRA